MLSMLTWAAAAQAATETVNCSDLQNGALNSATTGEVLQLSGSPAGSPCQLSVTVTNQAAFTLESVPGTEQVLEPPTADDSIIQTQGSTVPQFTLDDLEFTGSATSAVEIGSNNGAAVTIKDDLFSSDGAFNDASGGGVDLYDGGTSSADVTSIVGNTFADDLGYVGGGLFVQSDEPAVISGNTFTGDSAEYGGGGLYAVAFGASSTNPVTVSQNTFGGSAAADGNSAVQGGGAMIALAASQPLTLSGNLFEHDTTSGASADSGYPPTQADGGGLFLGNADGDGPYPVTQSHNTFLDDDDAATQSSGRYGGGGEWIQGLTVESTDDRFVDDEVSGGGGGTPGGGGLGAIAAAAEGSESALAAGFIGRNDLFSGNSTTVPGGWGGAIYIGFDVPGSPCTDTCPGSSLTLEDSTVVDNRVAAGTDSEGGAIWGDAYDTLAVKNSIIYGNTPLPEILGFSGTNPTFAYSDVCSEAGGPTVSGSGNICAAPKLNANGTETTASPTVDAGSNALVPAGLTTDLAGNPRIAANRETCAGSSPARVDMGAFEATFKPAPTCSAKVTIGSGELRDEKGKASVTLACPDGFEFCKGTVTLTTAKAIRPPKPKAKKHGKTKKRGKAKKLKLGGASFTIDYAKTGSVHVKLSKTALSELAKLKDKSVKLVISVKSTDAQKSTATSSADRTLKLP